MGFRRPRSSAARSRDAAGMSASNPAPVAGGLARFQDRFQRALLGADDEIPELIALTRQPAFAVYRNTVIKGCIDALQANYPAVSRLVGTEWFRAAAAIHVRRSPPRAVSMLEYGVDFPSFLAGFEPAAPMPWLSAVAQLDRCWTECHVAADATPLDTGSLTSIAPDALASSRLVLHPACRWRWCDDAPAYTLWSTQRDGDGTGAAAIDWRAEGALLTRPVDAVMTTRIDLAGCRFLDACTSGATIAQAAQAALEIDVEIDVEIDDEAGVDADAGVDVEPDVPADVETDLTALLATLLHAGAFTRLALPSRPSDRNHPLE